MELLPACCSWYLQTLGLYPAHLWLLSHVAFLSGPQFKVWRGACCKGIGEKVLPRCTSLPYVPPPTHELGDNLVGGAGGRGGTGGGERVVSALTLAVSLWHSVDSLPGLQWDGKDRTG